MAINNSFHVYLAGKGYLLADESYAWQAQKPFNPRFSTGDPTIGDLSFWQFQGQTKFTGGQGQRIFDDTSKYLASRGWDLSDGTPRLARDFAEVTKDNSWVAATGASNSSSAQTIVFGDSVYVFYRTGGTQFARTSIHTEDIAGGELEPQVYHVNATCGAVWKRDSANTSNRMVFGHGADLRIVDDAFATVATITATGINQIQGVTVINADILLIWGSIGLGDGKPVFERITFTSGTVTVSANASVVLHGSSGSTAGDLLCSSAKDGDGTIYLAIAEHTNASRLRAQTRVFRSTSADQTATAFVVSEEDPVNGFVLRAIFDVNGTVFLAGVVLVGRDSYQQAILKWPNVEIWRSRTIFKRTGATNGLTNSSTLAYFTNLADGYVTVREANTGLASVLRLDSTGKMHEVAAFPVDFSVDSAHEIVLALYDGVFLFGDTRLNKLYSQNDNRGIGPIALQAPLLELSEWGGNTPLIDKSPYRLIVELSEALPSGSPFTFYVNGTSVGTMTAADGKTKEIVITKNLTARKFSVSVEAPYGMRWNGYLDGVTLQFIPTQLKKLAWSFAIRADMSARLLSGQGDSRTADDIEQDVKAAWKSDLPVDFVDRDGREYKVIVTDVKGRVPLIGDDPNRRESIIPVEILEV